MFDPLDIKQFMAHYDIDRDVMPTSHVPTWLAKICDDKKTSIDQVRMTRTLNRHHQIREIIGENRIGVFVVEDNESWLDRAFDRRTSEMIIALKAQRALEAI